MSIPTRLVLATLLFVGMACSKDSTPRDATTSQQAVSPANAASPIEPVAKEVVAALRARDLARLAAVVHPIRGVRFSPYPHVDTLADRIVHRDELASLFANS